MLQKKRTIVTTNLDIDFLRTLASAEDLGGMNRAAERVGRSQSAVSQQMRKLEEKIGQRLFRKQGRGLVLTEPGELLLKYARRILALNDEAIAALHVLVSKAWCASACRATLPKPGCRRHSDNSSALTR
jgi:molybdenum-dependent DNA-binding transcriptional regulator ModE